MQRTQEPLIPRIQFSLYEEHNDVAYDSNILPGIQLHGMYESGIEMDNEDDC